MLKDIEEMRQEPVHHKAEISEIPREYYMYTVDDKDEKQDRSRKIKLK